MSDHRSPPPPALEDIDALGDEIATVAAHMTAALGRWLELVGRFDACEGWGRFGARSCAEWLAWRCSLSPTTAREHVRVARRLADLPLVAAALRAGELSFSKVRALTRLEHVGDEAGVLELARHATASQLDRIVRLTRRVAREEATEAIEERYLDVVFDDDSTAIIRGRVPAEDGALLLKALGHVDAHLTPPEPDAGVRPRSAARRADALAWMADRALAATTATPDGAGGSAGDQREVLVHIDARLLAQGGEQPEAAVPDSGDILGRRVRCDVEDRAPIAAETARRLCCDAGIVPVVRDGDRTLAVGRRTRAIPPAIRRALRARRPECAFPGCPRRRWLDAHHIVHWADGGRTDLDNLVHLCRHHHRLVHEAGWRIALDDRGRPRIQSPDGRELREVPALRPTSERGNEGVVAAPAAGATHALTPLSLGERYDLDLTIDAMLAWTRRPAAPPGGGEHPLAA